MASRAVRSRSFGAIADDYDRLRPTPPTDALDWLLPASAGARVVELGAGTGLVSRALRSRGGSVVAVEPDPRMRAVLAARTPDVAAVGAVAEALPLVDCCADAVVAASAWHWFDPERTLREIARVLRDGGRLGLVWTSRDRDVEWARELDSLRGMSHDSGQAHRVRRAWAERHHVTLPAGSPFATGERASFGFSVPMPLDDLVAVLGTYSAAITAEASTRDADLARARAWLTERFGHDATIDVPMRSLCWRADRLPRV